ncbi:MAG TPA: hypothetical protein VFD92_13090 [Candidatus Binatia bacterium]|nr:hypothetical protein [Candidatus Binatia bacterium]
MAPFAAIDFIAGSAAFLAVAWVGVMAVAAITDRRMIAPKRLALLCGAVILGLSGAAFAAPVNFADHLECRDVKDTAARQLYTINLASNELLRQDGCKVQVPAKQVCWATLEDGVFPPPYSAPAGPNLIGHYYLCYRMVCPRDVGEFVLADSLGGPRFVALRRAEVVCVPGY